jgi:soluble lytic murein transglycosylase
MRNYWMYQIQAKGTADCLTGMAQGMWPTFPNAKGVKLVRLSQSDDRASPSASMGGGAD